MLALVACLLGCDEEPARPWLVGSEYRYELDLRSTARSGTLPVPLFDLHVRGQLRVRPESVKTDAVVLGLQLSDLQVEASSGLDTPEKAQAYVKELERSYAVELRDGVMAGLTVPSGADHVAVALVRTLASTLQLAPAPEAQPASYEVEEYDATGRYVVRYGRDTPGEVRKHKQRYQSLFAVADQPVGPAKPKETLPEVTEASHVATLDGATLSAVSVKERISMPLLQTSKVHYANDVSLSLNAKRTHGDAAPDRSGDIYLPADKPYAAKPRIGQLDPVRIGDLSFEETVAQLEAIAKDYDPAELTRDAKPEDAAKQAELARQAAERNRYFAALAAHYRQSPGSIAQALERIRQGSGAASWLVNGFGASGTSEGQAALVEVMRDDALPLPLRKSAGVSLLQANKPTVASARVLESMLGDQQWSRYAMYGLGTYARRLREAGEDAEAARLVRVLSQRLSATTDGGEIVDLLGGLSNAADERALQALGPYMTHADPSVREAAVKVLRLVHSDDANAKLAERLEQEADASVRVTAINTATKRKEPNRALLGKVEALATKAEEVRVRIAAVRALGGWLPVRPEVRATLEAARQDDNPSVALLANAVLAPRSDK